MAVTGGYRPRRLPSLLFAGGLVGVFIGERALDGGRASNIVTALGVVCVAAALGWRLARLARASRSERTPEGILSAIYGAGALALILYFADGALAVALSGKTLTQSMPRLSGVIGALWPALIASSLLPALLVEMALGAMARAPELDRGRVHAALRTGVGLAATAIFCFSIVYVATERDAKVDLSYFRTARAGEASKRLVRALDKTVNVHLFFPPANEVLEQVDGYFSDLTKESKRLIVKHHDHALEPRLARELGVTGNGVVVIANEDGKLREQIPLPMTLESARNALRTLDQDVHKRIIGVARKDRVAYLTRGHGERAYDPAGEADRRATIKDLKQALTDQGFEPRDLGVAQGLATDVPEDAALVLIVGPQQPFLDEEIAALDRYLDRNGRLLVALDPESGPALDKLLAGLSLRYTPVQLANDRAYWRRAYQVADRVNIATSSYSSHASVSTIGKLGAQAPLIMMGAGHLEKNDKGAVGIVNVHFTVRSEPATWADANGNFELDEGAEFRNTFELGAAVTRRNASALRPEEEARVVVLADSDAIADVVIRNLGNAYLLLDSIRWLAGNEDTGGLIASEEDVAIAHTRKQDVAWFYGTVFAAPALVLGLGFAMTRRRRRDRKNQAPSSAPTAPASSAPPSPEAPPATPGAPTP